MKLLSPLGLRVQALPDSYGRSLEAEVRNAEEPFRGPKHMAGQYPQLHPKPQLTAVSGGGHQHHQGCLRRPKGRAAEVLQPIALLDEADDVRDLPAGDVELYTAKATFFVRSLPLGKLGPASPGRPHG
jgi:hypothetical protein